MSASPSRAPRVNDFVVKFANVNGSGSASANRLFARSILRMGVPPARVPRGGAPPPPRAPPAAGSTSWSP